MRDACDVLAGSARTRPASTLRPEARRYCDGFVSLEVSPRLAHDTDGHHRRGQSASSAEVDRPNVMIKIPATNEGLPAIRAVLAVAASTST